MQEGYVQEGYTGYGTYGVREVQVGVCELPVPLILSVIVLSVQAT